ncbi:DUF1707 SHOCT-like domain-containing protein [Streptomyces alkaliterrae]|uniref:DUF1707 SHOCT-like domain-containing protein n=1 Tax=Streptomyces alkaliterrae TaxID=2213162 RepID=UPI00389AA1B1
MNDVSLSKQPQPPEPERGPTAAEVRISDADRDRVADLLRDALAEGRLTPEEHSERVEAAYRARTAGELEPLLRDLPAGRPRPTRAPDTAGALAGPRSVVAIFSGATRKGRWRPGAQTTAFACFGGVEIDLSEAVFEQRETVVNATAIFGGVDIKVPENVTLRSSGSAVLGGFDVDEQTAEDPDAPVVIVRGLAIFGGVDASGKRGKRVRDLRTRRD